MLLQVEVTVFFQQLVYPLTHAGRLQHGLQLFEGAKMGGLQ